jgi:hypothetical protein
MSSIDTAQTELERLREENERLRKALYDKQLPAPKLPSLINDHEFLEDLARYADGTLSEVQVRRIHNLDETTWERLGKDDALVERIELRRIERTRSGQTKKELAQLHIVRGPIRLASIMDDPRANARHVVDSIKALNDLTGDTTRAEKEMDRVVVTINLGGDTKFRVEGNARPNPDSSTIINGSPNQNNAELIDVTPVDDPPPIKRGRGRPPGSKNKPKNDRDDSPPLPDFAT